jgi:hypothetical protein
MKSKFLKSSFAIMIFAITGMVNASIIEATITSTDDGFYNTDTGITYWDINKFGGLSRDALEDAGVVLEDLLAGIEILDQVIADYAAEGQRVEIERIMGALQGTFIWYRTKEELIAGEEYTGLILYNNADNFQLEKRPDGFTWNTYGSLVPAYAASAAPVYAPSTIVIFALGIMGLASRNFKKKS